MVGKMVLWLEYKSVGMTEVTSVELLELRVVVWKVKNVVVMLDRMLAM